MSLRTSVACYGFSEIEAVVIGVIPDDGGGCVGKTPLLAEAT